MLNMSLELMRQDNAGLGKGEAFLALLVNFGDHIVAQFKYFVVFI
jgi:hypothetical protein